MTSPVLFYFGRLGRVEVQPPGDLLQSLEPCSKNPGRDVPPPFRWIPFRHLWRRGARQGLGRYELRLSRRYPQPLQSMMSCSVPEPVDTCFDKCRAYDTLVEPFCLFIASDQVYFKISFKVGGCGLCHTDIGLMSRSEAEWFDTPPQFTTGHEIAAVCEGVVGIKM